ncbi:hypothetical protein FQN54_004802 [Arachnomyces sp. PD_36]|nr:hypothetical protein FQN54_004802 [Arachnomyces sp. PD_36]
MKPTYLATALLCAIATPSQCQTFDPSPGEGWDPSKVGTNTTTNATYSNPIFTGNVGDPWITRYEDWYLFTYTTTTDITLRRQRALTDNWDNAEQRVVFEPDPESGEPWSTSLWAPEVHNLDGTWYIIFTATNDTESPAPLQDALCDFSCPAVNHRMFVLESDGPDPWTANYTLKPMLDTFDQFAIDGTYFHHEEEMYHIYSCWDDAYSAWPANLCISKFLNPFTIDSHANHTVAQDRTTISRPDQPYEQVPAGRAGRLATNEGPQQLVNPHTGQNFVIYSAARVNTPFYCLAALELIGDDPMDAESWHKHADKGCMFKQNPDEEVYGTGHASFTTSPDGTEEFLVYHAQTTDYPSNDLQRTVRTQKFAWDPVDGTPDFPKALNGPFPVPSGQNVTTSGN